MKARAEAAEATRRRLAAVAMDRFLAEPYDEVTLTAIAEAAGVSQQTLLNHFGSKEGLFMAGVALFTERSKEQLYAAAPGDVARAVAVLVARYEESGDANVRLAMVEDRIDAVATALAAARASHQEWLETIFADQLPASPAQRRRAVHALYAATDVFTWKLLRRELGLSAAATRNVINDMVGAIVASWPGRG